MRWTGNLPLLKHLNHKQTGQHKQAGTTPAINKCAVHIQECGALTAHCIARGVITEMASGQHVSCRCSVKPASQQSWAQPG